jgi:hypothetical protein
MTDIISTDHPLNDDHRAILVALLDTLIPASDDGRLPGAGNLDLREFMDNPLNSGFESTVREAIDFLGEAFSGASPAAREERVGAFSTTQPEAFSQIYLQALAVYYRQDAVLRGIGGGEGPPFPRGNEVAEVGLSLLDPVVANPKPYRPA